VTAGGEPVRIERTDAVIAVTLSRPQVRNAIDESMLAGLERACAEAAADPTLAAVVLRGDGGFFSAGGDRQERARLMAEGGRDALAERSRREGLLLRRIARLPAIVVAAVEGGAIGLALGMVAAADLVLAARPAVFAAPEVTIGAMPAQIAPFIIGRSGAGQARRLLLTGVSIDADEAFRLGIVHEVLADQAMLDQAVAAQLTALRRIDPATVAATKGLLAEAEHGNAAYIATAAARYADFLFGRSPGRPPSG
jgi:isohexenylglutaconyl-CoA hydratase